MLAWIYHVAGDQLNPQQVYCAMQHSDASGADLSHSATIRCSNNVVLNVSGTCLLPGNEHGDPPVGKEIQIQIYGSGGALFYSGNDHDPSSGKLELRAGKNDQLNDEGEVDVIADEFLFENTDKTGEGPESLLTFLAACRGETDYYVGANSNVGLKSVQTLEAMYRSQDSGQVEEVAYRNSAGARKRRTSPSPKPKTRSPGESPVRRSPVKESPVKGSPTRGSVRSSPSKLAPKEEVMDLPLQED
mgnify:CR=1 FL=1